MGIYPGDEFLQESIGRWAESRELSAESEEQRARGLRAESMEQRAKGKKQRTESKELVKEGIEKQRNKGTGRT